MGTRKTRISKPPSVPSRIAASWDNITVIRTTVIINTVFDHHHCSVNSLRESSAARTLHPHGSPKTTPQTLNSKPAPMRLSLCLTGIASITLEAKLKGAAVGCCQVSNGFCTGNLTLCEPMATCELTVSAFVFSTSQFDTVSPQT